jgi:hypothetical protein
VLSKKERERRGEREWKKEKIEMIKKRREGSKRTREEWKAY